MRSLILSIASLSFGACITLLWADQPALAFPFSIASLLCGLLMKEA